MTNTKQNMSGRIVFITGGAGGIGLETGRRLAAQGATVALVDHDVESARSAAAALGQPHIGVYADVTDIDSLTAAVVEVRKAYGGIDVVMCNAGIGSASTVRASDTEALLRIVDANLNGQIRTVKATLESVIERRGYIVFTCSAAVLKNVPKSSAYAAAKAGVDAFAGALRLEIAHLGVDVGVVYPGWVPTALITGTGKRGADGSSLPWPFNIVTSLDECGQRYAETITRRLRNAYIPKIYRYVHLIRPLFTGRRWDNYLLPGAAIAVPLWEKDLPADASVSGGC